MNNSLTLVDDQDNVSTPSPLARAVISLFGFILCLAIFVGNGMVLLLLIRFRHLRTPTNIFISGMAVSDFFVGITMMSRLVQLNSKLTPIECLLFLCNNAFCGVTGCLTLLLVSLDRYLKVLLPIRYHTIMSNKVAVSTVLCLYVYAIFIAYGLPLAGLKHDYIGFAASCLFQFPKIVHQILLQFLIFVNVLLPLLLVCVMYVHLFRVVRNKLHEVRTQYDSASVGMRSLRLSWLKRDFNTMKTIAMLLGFCVVGWVPRFSVILVGIYNPSYQPGLAARIIVSYLSCFNSAINPILYSLRSEHFRQSARRMICGKESLRNYRRKRRGASVYPMTTFALSPEYPVTSDNKAQD